MMLLRVQLRNSTSKYDIHGISAAGELRTPLAHPPPPATPAAGAIDSRPNPSALLEEMLDANLVDCGADISDQFDHPERYGALWYTAKNEE